MLAMLFSTKYLALATLVLQNTFLVVCMHYSRTISAKEGSIFNMLMRLSSDIRQFFDYRNVLFINCCSGNGNG